MKLFQTHKVGVYVTKIDHNTERRRDGEVQVLVLSCRIHPFDHKLAQSMDAMVRASLFKLSGDADPLAHVQGCSFALPIDRQDIDIFATPDTSKPSIRFEQVKVSCLKAKLEKGSRAYVASFKLTFGPVSAKELEYCHAARTTQKFMNFVESEPDLAYEEVGGGQSDEDDEDEPTERPQPMFEDPRDDRELVGVGAAVAKPDRANRKMHSHTGKKKKSRR